MLNHSSFKVSKNNCLYVTKIDNISEVGWNYPHYVDICINSNETIYLFKESMNGCLENASVTHNNIKILDSRDIIEKNYRLMNLKLLDISAQHTSNIRQIIDGPIPKLNKLEFNCLYL